MLYENYQRKIIKISTIKKWIKRNRVIIITVAAIIFALLTSCLSVKGVVYASNVIPTQVIYGDDVPFRANAFFDSVSYEYTTEGTEEWTANEPRRIGEYQIRARTENILGSPYYSKPQSYKILPKAIDVAISTDSIMYGEKYPLSAQLVFEDSIDCEVFHYENLSKEHTQVTADKSAVVITDGAGNNVTDSYIVNTISSKITFIKRPITVTVASKTAIYDGTALSFGGYEVSKGRLAVGDNLLATFDKEQIDAGETDNTAQIKVATNNGYNVSELYDIEIISGKLTVEKRPVFIKTHSVEKVYDGLPLSFAEFTPDNSLVSGHRLELAKAASLTNVGTSDNLLVFKVFDGKKDVTNNYSFLFPSDSKLKVTPRTITIKTSDASKEYDGLPLTNGDYTVESELKPLRNHQLKLDFSGGQTRAGQSANTVEDAIMTEDGSDVTKNYHFEYLHGVLSVTPRSIMVQTDTATLDYNGRAQSSGGAKIISERDLVQGESMRAVAPKTLTDIGTVQNEFSIKIFDGDGSDVSASYIIEYVYGSLTIKKSQITVETATDELFYNGRDQSLGEFVVTPNIAEGQTSRAITPLTTLKQVEKNKDGVYKKYDNVFKIAIFSGENDVTYNYDISYVYGTLEMRPQTVHVKTGSKEFVYNGEFQSHSSFEVITEIVDECSFRVVSGTETFVRDVVRLSGGSFAGYDNKFKVEMYSESAGISDNYSIEYEYGELTMLPRHVTITTATNSWEYDGTAHSDEGYGVTSGSLVGGHVASFLGNVRTSITDVVKTIDETVGSVDNKFDVKIIGKDSTNVTENYEISYVYGTLTILPRPITITTTANSWVYDGLKHYDKGFSVTLGKLVANHIVRAEGEMQTVTNVGDLSNEFSVEIFNGNDFVTDNYKINYIYGTISVTKRPITIKPEFRAREYNGLPFTSSTYYITSTLRIVEGQWTNNTCKGSQTEIGRSENAITEFKIFSGAEDVTYNYDISRETNMLEVTRISISVYAGSDSKEFDGTELTSSEFYGGNLLQGHTLNARTFGAQTEVGIGINSILAGSVRITSDGKDVSDYYNIRLHEGKLHVWQKKITLRTFSNEKEYDGTPLTDGRYEIIGELIEGHRESVAVHGSRTDVGESFNYAYISILNEDMVHVTHFYSITYEYGKLTVTGDSGDLNTDGSIDRDSAGSGGSGGTGADKILFKATSSTTNKVYFRVKSFGDYTTDGWKNATPYSMGNINALQLMGKSLDRSGKKMSSISIETISKDLSYMLPYYAQNGYGTLDDTRINIAYSSPYNFAYIPYTYNSNDAHSVRGSSYEAFEREYYEYVLKTYLQLPEITRDTLMKIAAKNNLKATSKSIISDVASFVQNAVKYDLNFDSYLGDIAVYFFTKAETGICQHYATAATAMYRALGIPARYSIGFVGDMSAGKSVDVSSAQAHAWVEVYLPGAGWVQIEVTGAGSGSGSGGGGGSGEEDGEGEFATKTLTIKPKDLNKVYDGMSLIAKNEVEGYDLESLLMLQELLDFKYRYSVSVTGSLLEYGESESHIQNFVLYDEYGRNVTEQYNIIYKPGRLRITHTPIYINLYGLEKYYDGMPLSYESQDYWVDNLPVGFRLDFSLSGVLTDTGMLRSSDFESLQYTVYDQNNSDVTSQYSLVFLGKPLRIYKRDIEITSASVTKTYDGTVLFSNTTWISKGFFPPKHKYEAIVIGKITDIGLTKNSIEKVTIYDEKGKNVTTNYNITIAAGILKIIAN